MKYETLKLYRKYLETKYSKETATTYYFKMIVLLETFYQINVVDFDFSKVLDKLSEVVYKNTFSQYKNALFNFCEFLEINITDEQLKAIGDLESKTKKRYKKTREINGNKVERKIRYIRNEKLKLSYQVMLATGLRVSELSGIKQSDVDIHKNRIVFHIIAKGGKKDKLILEKSQNAKLFADFEGYVIEIENLVKPFYSAPYLQKKAKELGFACHDLRRIYAKHQYIETKSKHAVKTKLRHMNVKTTNIYLRSKVKLIRKEGRYDKKKTT